MAGLEEAKWFVLDECVIDDGIEGELCWDVGLVANDICFLDVRNIGLSAAEPHPAMVAKLLNGDCEYDLLLTFE